MTDHHENHENHESTTESESFSSRFARWLEDPFASAFMATGATAMAVTFVLSGMWLVNTAIS